MNNSNDSYYCTLFRHKWIRWLCINSKLVFWTYLPLQRICYFGRACAPEHHVQYVHHCAAGQDGEEDTKEVPREYAILNAAHVCILHLTLDFCPNLHNKASSLCTCNFTVFLSTEIFNTLDTTGSAGKSLALLSRSSPFTFHLRWSRSFCTAAKMETVWIWPISTPSVDTGLISCASSIMAVNH